ncbi:MAG: response regulator transcription factor, partial [Rubrobacteraceae bacterium]
ERDLAAFLSFLGGIHGCLDLDGFASCVVETLPNVVASDLTSYSEVDPRRRRAIWVMEPVPPDFPELHRLFERQVREHADLHNRGRTRDAEELKVSDFLARSRFRHLGLYDDLHRMIGAKYRLSTELPTPPPIVIGISLNRSETDFSEHERHLLDMLRPHIAQAHRNAETATETRKYLTSTRQAVEELDQGVVALSASGRVQWATDRARRLVTEHFGSFANGRLPRDLRRWFDEQRFLPSANGVVPALPEPLIIERLGQRLVARFVADPAENRYLLLLEKQPLPFSEKTLESLGLTRRESEILVWIARGKTNNEVAEALYISPRTVKKHLEHIYHKLAVESRTEAVSRALEIFGLV